MKTKFLSTLVGLIILLLCNAQLTYSQQQIASAAKPTTAAKKKTTGHTVFKFKYYELWKDKSPTWDSVTRWENAKYKKTFENHGTILTNTAKGFVKVKLTEDSYEQVEYISKVFQDHTYLINGKRVYKYTDPERGPVVAVHQNDGGKWILYFQNKRKPSLSSSSNDPL